MATAAPGNSRLRRSRNARVFCALGWRWGVGGAKSSLERRPRRRAEKRRVYGDGDVVALGASRCPRKSHDRESAGPQRQSRADARSEGAGLSHVVLKGHPPLVRGNPDADRPVAERVLEAFLKQQDVRSAEAVVVEARERAVAVDIRAAQCRLKVERYDVANRRRRSATRAPARRSRPSCFWKRRGIPGPSRRSSSRWDCSYRAHPVSRSSCRAAAHARDRSSNGGRSTRNPTRRTAGVS